MSEAGHGACGDFLEEEGLAPSHRWVKLGFVPHAGRVVSQGAFIGSCEVSAALGTLSSVG